MSRRVQVRVPASAVLGFGPAAAVVAVDRWLALSAELRRADGASVEYGGTLARRAVTPDADHAVIGFRIACEAARRAPPAGFQVRIVSRIPVGRGLGASAAATLAGVVAANALLDLALDDESLIRVAGLREAATTRIAAAFHGDADGAPHVHHRTTLYTELCSGKCALIVAFVNDDAQPLTLNALRFAASAGAARVIPKGDRTLFAIAHTDDAPRVAARLDAVLAAVGANAEVFVNPASVAGHRCVVQQVCDDEPQPVHQIAEIVNAQ